MKTIKRLPVYSAVYGLPIIRIINSINRISSPSSYMWSLRLRLSTRMGGFIATVIRFTDLSFLLKVNHFGYIALPESLNVKKGECFIVPHSW